MMLHPTTFEYLKPTEAQLDCMSIARAASKEYAALMDRVLPDGPDKTYLIRKIREIAMWANVAITRNADGSPRVHGMDVG